MQYYPYGEAEINYLKSKDKKLGAAIDAIGMLQRPIHPDMFSSLIRSIVAQQISSKAAVTVYDRLEALCGESITPEAIEGLSAEQIQQCGMSLKKAGYIKGAAQAVLDGRLEIDRFPEMADEEIIAQMVALDGIGLWTTEMLMIFTLQRPDVLSYGDLAIRRGMMMLYGHKEMPRARFERYRRRYSPHCTVASLYFWHIASNEYL